MHILVLLKHFKLRITLTKTFMVELLHGKKVHFNRKWWWW